MFKKWLAIFIASLTLFTSAPIAFADDINNSPNITTDSNSQSLTLSKKSATQAKKAGNNAGKSAGKFSDKLYEQGNSSVDHVRKASKSLSAVTSEKAFDMSGGTVNLPGNSNVVNGLPNRLRLTVNWLGQNAIAILMMLLIFTLVIVILVLAIRIVFKLFGIGKSSIGKLLGMLIGAIIFLTIVNGFSGMFGYGFGFYQVFRWILTGS